jgi:hypothetical protein
MGTQPVYRIFWCILLLSAAACILQPVMADNGTITIAYRGSGGSYIGETVVFDGRNTYGNSTLIRIAGPGLPAEGVPINNLNGPAGTGTPVEVDRDGAWKFVWYASITPGIGKLKTARYTITATDSRDPQASFTTFFMLKKPEYSITASPNPVNPGNYVELIGSAEEGLTTAKIEIADSSGTVLHTFTSPVSSSGYFSYGFHVDMKPGTYPVTVTSPGLSVPFGTVITVVPEEGTGPAPAVTNTEQVPVVTTSGVTPETTAVPATSPAKSPVLPLTILAGLIAGAMIAGTARRP